MRPRARLSEFESELCHWLAMWLWASDLSSVCLYVKWDTNSTHFTEFLMRTKRTLDSWDSSGFPWMRSSPICLWSSHQWRKAHSRDSCREDDSEAHMRAKSLHLCPTLCNPMTLAYLAPIGESMGFSRKEYWHGLPCSPPRDLPGPGVKPMSLRSPALAGRFFTTSATWEALYPHTYLLYILL